MILNVVFEDGVFCITTEHEDRQGDYYTKENLLVMTPVIEECLQALRSASEDDDSLEEVQDVLITEIQNTCGNYRRNHFWWSTWDDLIDHYAQELEEELVAAFAA